MVKITKDAALEYHRSGKPGKIEVNPTKPYSTQTDLSLAYSPGVAFPCLEIQKEPNDVITRPLYHLPSGLVHATIRPPQTSTAPRAPSGNHQTHSYHFQKEIKKELMT